MADLSSSAENSIVAERRAKLSAIRSQRIAYPNDFIRQSTAQDLHTHFGYLEKSELEQQAIFTTVAGRMMFKRVMGKASFATLQDGSNSAIQLYISCDMIEQTVYEEFKHWDLGDIVGAQGILFKTKTNELSIKVSQLRLLSKSLRPLPEKFHGLNDQEQKYRQRYLDLIANEKSRDIFIKRSKIIQVVREFMHAEKYLEVETPMMHSLAGGASAKPFVTYHNALDMSLYLRIAPELFLKRLVVGGLERVFEINRNFRNEGMSTRHNPEFTMLEFYEAYADYKYMMDFTERLIRYCAQQVLNETRINYQGRPIDLGKAFARFTLPEAIAHYNPQYSVEKIYDIAFLKKELENLGNPTSDPSLGRLQLLLFEATTEEKLWEPTFITHYPAEVSPLARLNDHDPTVTDRFELFIVGRELANAYSELNDPEDQAKRFLAQVQQKEAGDHEAMCYDQQYIEALEYAMPPTAGCGIGIDRLVMLLTDAASIRDVILFPQMRVERN